MSGRAALSTCVGVPRTPLGHPAAWRDPANGSGATPTPARGEVVAPVVVAQGLRGPPPSGQLQPLVPPQVLHFMQVPLRTSV